MSIERGVVVLKLVEGGSDVHPTEGAMGMGGAEDGFLDGERAPLVSERLGEVPLLEEGVPHISDRSRVLQASVSVPFLRESEGIAVVSKRLVVPRVLRGDVRSREEQSDAELGVVPRRFERRFGVLGPSLAIFHAPLEEADDGRQLHLCFGGDPRRPARGHAARSRHAPRSARPRGSRTCRPGAGRA